MNKSSKSRTVGIIANPFSSRDIRRVISCATTLQTSERANIVIRIIVALGYFGAEKIVMMPDRSGIRSFIMRNLHTLKKNQAHAIPEIEFIDMPVRESIVDTETAAAYLHEIDVDCVVVLGGDGTSRAVAKKIDQIPIVGISTGTNNAFPKFYEATLAGMAVSLFINDTVPDSVGIEKNKKILIYVNGEYRDMALVDVAITSERWIGSKALWHMEHLKEIFLAFCEPNAIGMSAIGGLLSPVERQEAAGLSIEINQEHHDENQASVKTVSVPIAPGLFETIQIMAHKKMSVGQRQKIKSSYGVVALDGEREIEFFNDDIVEVELSDQGPNTIAVSNVIEYAAKKGIFINQSIL